MHNLVELKLPAKKEYIPIVRYAAMVYANDLGFDFERIEDIKLVISEAINNAVIHSDFEDAEVVVNLYSHGEGMKIEVRDSGKGFHTSNYEAPNLDNEQCSGYGIYIMQTLSDSVEVISGDGRGTHLIIEFNLV